MQRPRYHVWMEGRAELRGQDELVGMIVDRSTAIHLATDQALTAQGRWTFRVLDSKVIGEHHGHQSIFDVP